MKKIFYLSIIIGLAFQGKAEAINWENWPTLSKFVNWFGSGDPSEVVKSAQYNIKRAIRRLNKARSSLHEVESLHSQIQDVEGQLRDLANQNLASLQNSLNSIEKSFEKEKVLSEQIVEKEAKRQGIRRKRLIEDEDEIGSDKISVVARN